MTQPTQRGTPEPEDENIRRAIDILEKWCVAINEKWASIRSQMEQVGLNPPDVFKIDDLDCILATGPDGHLSISVNGKWATPYEAFRHPYLDVEKLSELRRRTAEGFKAYEATIEDARKHLEHSAAQRKEKLKTLLPSVIDDFGADILMYGDGRPKPPPESVEDGAIAHMPHMPHVGLSGVLGIQGNPGSIQVTVQGAMQPSGPWEDMEAVNPAMASPGTSMGPLGAAAAIAGFAAPKTQTPNSHFIQKASPAQIAAENRAAQRKNSNSLASQKARERLMEIQERILRSPTRIPLVLPPDDNKGDK